MNVQLISDGFRNSTFEENLDFFSAAYPEVYALIKNHEPQSHRLCLNPDGTPNIINIAEKTVLYPGSTEEIDALNERKVLGMERNLNFPRTYLLAEENQANNYNAIQNQAYSGLLEITPVSIKQIDDAEGRTDHRIQEGDSTYLPFVRVYGVGLGTYLIKLIKEKTVFCVSIVEPNLDLFFASLFVIPWKIIHQYFSIGKKRMSLIVGDTPENSIKRESAFIQSTFPFLTSNFGRLTMIDDETVLAALKSAEKKQDSLSYNSLSAGWYDDQKFGLHHSLLNIRARRLFFTGNKTTDFLRVFVIGSGPSLDESLEYIRRNCDRAIIFACGSALSPLLAAGIIPDCHIVQERVWQEDTLQDSKERQLLRQVRLLKLNVVSPSIDFAYKETYVFQKFMDPGSALLGPSYPATQGVNPTVTNAGVAFATELGANEVYLFGVDYGRPADKETWYSSGTVYDNGLSVDYAKEETCEVEGNFGVPIVTTPILYHSLDVTETIIGRNKHCKFVNVGDGAYIAGTEEYRVHDLPQLSLLFPSKRAVEKQISACFDASYSSEELFENFNKALKPAIESYLDSLRIFHDAAVTTRDDIIHILSMLCEAVDTGYSNPDFIPSSLLNGGIKRLIESIYLQSTLAASDAEAVSFFEGATLVLDEYYAAVLKDLDRVFQSSSDGIELFSSEDLIATAIPPVSKRVIRRI